MALLRKLQILFSVIAGAAILPFACYAGLACFNATTGATHDCSLAFVTGAAATLAIVGATASFVWLVCAMVNEILRRFLT